MLHLWLCSAAHPASEYNSSIMEETNWNRSMGTWEKLLEENFNLYFKLKKEKAAASAHLTLLTSGNTGEPARCMTLTQAGMNQQRQ